MIAELFVATIYLQLARGAKLCARFRSQCHKLAAQRLCLAHCYGMRTDPLDRFGTRLDHRMTKAPDQGDDGIGRMTGRPFFQRGLVLVREAGGIVTNIIGTEFDPFTPDCLAANPALHAAMLAVLQKGLS